MSKNTFGYRHFVMPLGLVLYFLLFVIFINPYRVYSTFSDFQLFSTILVGFFIGVSSFLVYYLIKKIRRTFLIYVCIPIIYTVSIWILFNDAAPLDLLLMSFSASIVPLLFFFLITTKRNSSVALEFENVEEKDETLLKILGSNKEDEIDIQVSAYISFEANDNYVNIHFIDENGNVQKKMIRSTLKSVADQLEGKDCFFKIHRSIIINKIHLQSISGGSQNRKARMKSGNLEFPIARSFDLETLK